MVPKFLFEFLKFKYLIYEFCEYDVEMTVNVLNQVKKGGITTLFRELLNNPHKAY